MPRLLLPLLIATFSLTPSLGTARAAEALEKFGDPEFKCVSFKQRAAGYYTRSAFKAWAEWDRKQDESRREKRLAKAGVKLATWFRLAEAWAAKRGVDCVDQTLNAPELAARIQTAALEIVTAINAGLDLEDRRDAKCGKKLLEAAGRRSRDFLNAESWHTWRAAQGGAKKIRSWLQERAERRFSKKWNRAHCPTDASESEVASQLDALGDDVVFHTVVSPTLDASEFQPISPVGPIEYEGRTLEPRCGFDDDPGYHFFVKRGSVNKVVMYYQGGGACWDGNTCGLPVCKDAADPVTDDPDNFSGGFANLFNPQNPFKDWNIVFVTYCTCDIHFGDADMSYTGIFGPVDVSHRGFQNAKVVEKFARENFLNPEVVFVSGSSAGGYGALFHGPLLHSVWPAAEFKVLGDASSGVITSSFLQNEFNNWNFAANLPDDIPGVVESITGGEGMVAYTEAVANHFPETTWANYTTAYDGGSGGQTGFYNLMLNNSNLFAALTWWNASCQFNDVMVGQADDTFSRAPLNYRYYIESGSRHTTWGSDTVYTGQIGTGPQTVAEWVDDMLSFDPLASPMDDWQNISCGLCNIVLPGDPGHGRSGPPFVPFLGFTFIGCP